MEIKDLQNFAKRDHERVKEKLCLGDKEIVLAHAVKLGEELGELNEEILKRLNYRVRNKPQGENDLEHEFADVLIVASILAESMGVDIKKALEEKMEKIDGRYK